MVLCIASNFGFWGLRVLGVLWVLRALRILRALRALRALKGLFGCRVYGGGFGSRKLSGPHCFFCSLLA